MDYATHNDRMVARFIWLETLDPDYARETLEAYRLDPNSPNRRILTDIRAEKQRRLSSAAPESK